MKRWTIWHCAEHGWVDTRGTCDQCDGGLDPIEVVLASEVERLREAGEELATEIDDEIIRSVMIKHDSPDAVERARGAVERYRAALNASDGGATLPAT